MSERWTALKAQCFACQKCELCKSRTNVVFGQGVTTAEILFIGEGPGRTEDEMGLPFVGRSGKLLDELLGTVGLSREKNIYIANIVKCRPPENRDPLVQERNACMPWLKEQLSILQPKIVVCLGRVAAQVIIRPGFSVMKEHGQWTEKDGAHFTATLHPAALLRNPHNKPLALEDFAAIHKKAKQVCLTMQ